MEQYNIGIVGATGAVGQEMIKTVVDRQFPYKSIRLFASARSKGKKLPVGSDEIEVEELTEQSFDDQDIQIALFSAGASRSKQFAPLAAKNNVVVIDNSSAFRMDPDVPLVVPEVNPHHLEKHKNIIANPNCSTIQMVVVLKPLHDFSKINRIVVSTYQAVSGHSLGAISELQSQVEAYVKKEELKIEKFPFQIAFNCIPHIDVFLENNYTKEEVKMMNETRKILDDENIKVTATTVRVPVFRAHSESVNIETESKISREKAIELLEKAPGVKVIDDPNNLKYPMPIYAEGRYDTFVGRIREDVSVDNGLAMWIVSDNLLKGAALNAIQIAETMIERKLI